MNIVNLVGRLTKKPELRYTTSNKACVRINIAADRHLSKEDKDAGKKSADFIPLVFWDKGAENLAKYCDKGSQISIEGRLIDGTYEKQDGSKGYTLEEFDAIKANIDENNGENSESAKVDANINDKVIARLFSNQIWYTKADGAKASEDGNAIKIICGQMAGESYDFDSVEMAFSQAQYFENIIEKIVNNIVWNQE